MALGDDVQTVRDTGGKGWLTPSEQRRLGRELAALLPLGRTYHVGSSVFVESGRTPRDIDLRLMLDDDVHAALTPEQWRIIGDHIGRSLEASTGVARLDFQIQSITEANRDHQGPRSALFVRDYEATSTEGETP